MDGWSGRVTSGGIDHPVLLGEKDPSDVHHCSASLRRGMERAGLRCCIPPNGHGEGAASPAFLRWEYAGRYGFCRSAIALVEIVALPPVASAISNRVRTREPVKPATSLARAATSFLGALPRGASQLDGPPHRSRQRVSQLQTPSSRRSPRRQRRQLLR